MLYHLFDYLEQLNYSGAGVFQYITFRAGAAVLLALFISFYFGQSIIYYLQKQQIGETVRDLGLAGQMAKQGTPTMGGVIIVISILVPCLLFARLDNVYILLMIVSTLWLACIGFLDDYIKVFKKDKEGLKGKFKVLGQIGLGIIVGVTMLLSDDIAIRLDTNEAKELGYTESLKDFKTVEGEKVAYYKSTMTNMPFLKDNSLDYADFLFFLDDDTAQKYAWVVFLFAIIFIITGVSNAANLTDGIDGLATGISGIIGFTLLILAYVSGNVVAADYLDILFIPHTGELVIFCACFLGACVGFLWYNAYPAQVFMGDTGSLTLGGIIAALAILIRKELLIPILCGVFLIETLSVILQVYYFKYTRKKYGEGRRLFKMSPIHHHFQKMEIPEPKIVTRFWIVGVFLAIVTILTLKIR